jgi:hypothetical protein
MPADLNLVRLKVQEIVTAHGKADIWSDTTLTLDHGSTRVFIRTREIFDGENTLVSVFAPVGFNLKASPELWEHICIKNSKVMFGSLGAEPDDKGGFTLLFEIPLLGDYLDEAELMTAVRIVAVTADEFDDQFAEMFGGVRFSEWEGE